MYVQLMCKKLMQIGNNLKIYINGKLDQYVKLNEV